MWRGVFLWLAWPALAVAQTPYDGRYAVPGFETGPCVYDGSDNGVFEVRDGAFWSVESRCMLTNPVPVRDMEATLYDAQCAGEGESWSERMMLYRTYEGIAVLSRGVARTFRACQ